MELCESSKRLSLTYVSGSRSRGRRFISPPKTRLLPSASPASRGRAEAMGFTWRRWRGGLGVS